eukprot:155406-Rhodomonas_salina.2
MAVRQSPYALLPASPGTIIRVRQYRAYAYVTTKADVGIPTGDFSLTMRAGENAHSEQSRANHES